jgi:hypothetical protein
LRHADRFNEERRNDPYLFNQLSPEQAKIITFARKLNKIFATVSKSLENFQKADVLKTAYLQAFVENQVLWDDIAYENKLKLITTSQQLLQQLRILLENQQSEETRHNSFYQCLIELQEVADRTQILGAPGQDVVDQLEVEDLFQILTQCMSTLEAIKISHTSDIHIKSQS